MCRSARAAIFVSVVPLLLGCPSQAPPDQPVTVPEPEVAEEEVAPEPEPAGTASGWIETEGERTELSMSYALRYEDCPGNLVTAVVVTNRPLDLAEIVTPLSPIENLEREVGMVLREDGDTYVVITHRAGRPYLVAQRRSPGRRDVFNGPGFGDPQRPEIAVDDGERIEGGWTGETAPDGWLGHPSSFDFEFAAPVSSAWLAGEELPADGGEPGAVAGAYLAAVAESDVQGARRHASDLIASWPEPDASPEEVESTLSFLKMSVPSEWEIVGGRSDGERAIVGWSGEAMNGAAKEGFLFLARNDAGEWEIVASSPCIRY